MYPELNSQPAAAAAASSPITKMKAIVFSSGDLENY